MNFDVLTTLKNVGGGLAALGAIGTSYVYLDLPQPVMRSEYERKLKELEQHAGETKSQVIDSQLQTNRLNMQFLRKEKFDREMDIERITDPSARNAIRNRQLTIDDELREIDRERERLIKEKR